MEGEIDARAQSDIEYLDRPGTTAWCTSLFNMIRHHSLTLEGVPLPAPHNLGS